MASRLVGYDAVCRRYLQRFRNDEYHVRDFAEAMGHAAHDPPLTPKDCHLGYTVQAAIGVRLQRERPHPSARSATAQRCL